MLKGGGERGSGQVNKETNPSLHILKGRGIQADGPHQTTRVSERRIVETHPEFSPSGPKASRAPWAGHLLRIRQSPTTPDLSSGINRPPQFHGTQG